MPRSRRLGMAAAAAVVCALPTTASASTASTAAGDSGDSNGWLVLVVIGLVATIGIGAAIVRMVLGALPEDVKTPVQRTLRDQATPVAVGVTLLIATITFGLYSASKPGESASLDTAAGTGASQADGSTQAGVVGPTASGGPRVASGTGSQTVTGTGSAATGQTGTTATGTGTGAGPGSAPRPHGAALGAAPAKNVADANLFTAANNTRGITNNNIKICGHAALSLGPVFATDTSDLLVFWNYLNDKGGLYGRKFTVTLKDDRYDAAGGVPAAQACAQENPFMIFGALGSDVLPPVRRWAEENKELYLYGFSAKKGTEKFKYSYSNAPGQEDLATIVADVIVKRFPKSKVGLIWRDSSNVQPGRDVFKKRIAGRGPTLVADIATQKSQGNYSAEVIELKSKGADVVFMLDDALSQVQLIKQAHAQDYKPNFYVFGFNLQLQTLSVDDVSNPPLRGTNLAPSYTCHQFGGTYASYAKEIKEFEAAYAKYDPDLDLCGNAGDIAWGSWIAFKFMATLFEACGPDCTRNHFAGLLDSGYKLNMPPACPVDFGPDPHHAFVKADEFLVQNVAGRPAWTGIQRCLSAR
jgi:ABC-type branched-subunit amino acid transport system substrate-binding protein